jgi:hypothetical protein
MRSEQPVKNAALRNGCPMRPPLPVVALASLVAVLAGCASKRKEAKSDYTDLNLGQRVVKQTKDPFSIKSPYQQEVYNAKRSVKTSDFKAGAFHGKKTFESGRDNFRTSAFAQAGKTSSASDKSFSGANEKSNLADDTYKTSGSQFDGKVSRSAGQTSPMGDDKFKTRSNPAALKNVDNVKRPLIEKDSGYTEDEVKKLLNKD